MRPAVAALLSLAVFSQAFARLERSLCGTHRDLRREQVHLHRSAVAKRRTRALASVPPPSASRDIGEIAILEDSDGVVARRNEFNLDQRTVRFHPSDARAARYRFETASSPYVDAAGSPLALGDDDTTEIPLPFSFPFFGAAYSRVFVNSDGNLTFLAGDTAVSDRSLGRVVAGPPRIAALFMDLDPTQRPNGVLFVSEPARVIIAWNMVPEYQGSGPAAARTFQIRLYPDGRIEIAYNGVAQTSAAIVGISPGGQQGPTSIVSFLGGSNAEFSGAVVERFGGVEEIDIVTASQQFYRAHDDTYDFLVFYNNLGIDPCPGSVACEVTVRNHRTGYGDPLVDDGAEFGSASRLQAIMNMGPLSQYPRDPSGIVPGRASIRDTPITVLAHEAGHLFLAYASVRDTADPVARPMLGFQGAHWAFTFNSEASLLEGNRILDKGPAAYPRFETTGTVEGFSLLDQYIMGLRPPEEVAPVFFVARADPRPTGLARTGVQFNGERRDVQIHELIAAEGRRTPDSTVSQRRFRFAFVLIVRQGTTPSQAELDQIDTYRREFESYFSRATSDRAIASATLRSSLRLSTFPAAGVITGRSMTATVSIQQPAPAPLSVALRTQTGAASVAPSVTIPAGATSASFTLTGNNAGIDELSAEASDARYDRAISRIQVLAAPDAAALTLTSRQGSTIRLRVSDSNNLPYPGVSVLGTSIGGGAVTPPAAVSGADGGVTFTWTPGPGSAPALMARIEGATGSPLFVSPSVFSFTAPVNAASGAPGLSPGVIASIYGSGLARGVRAEAPFPWPDTLAGVRVLLDGSPAPVMFVSNSQVNFLVPLERPTGPARVTLVTPDGAAEIPAPDPLARVSPGIFFDPSNGFGAILNPGTANTTTTHPVAASGYVEIYCTGLGPAGAAALAPQVTIGGLDAPVSFSGLAPGYLGLYQVNVQIPQGLAPGEQPLRITIDGVQSNIVKIGIR